MTINVIDRLAPLGSFPICADADFLGGMRSVTDNTARDAIVVADRQEGMFVFVNSTVTLYRLGAGLTNGDWVIVPLGAGGATSVRNTFVDGDLVAGVLTVTHSLGVSPNQVSIYDNSDNLVWPDAIFSVDVNNTDITLSSFQSAYGGALLGTWNYVITG